MPQTDRWKKGTQEELERRLGREMLCLMEDTRKDAVLREDVTRWILIVRDLSLEAACATARDLFQRQANLENCLNLNVYGYSQAMDWAQEGWPEWLQTIQHAKFLHAEEGIENVFRNWVSDEVPVDSREMGVLLNDRSIELAKRLKEIDQALIETYCQYLLADVQSEYLVRYPESGRGALLRLGSPSMMMQELDMARHPDLSAQAEKIRKLVEYFRANQSPGESAMESYIDFIKKTKAEAKATDEEAGAPDA